MRIVYQGLLIVTILGSILVLGLSVWPGVLNDLLSVAAFVLVGIIVVFRIPIALVAIIVWLLVILTRVDLSSLRHVWRRLLRDLPKSLTLVVVSVATLTLILLIFYVPRRVPFLLSRSSFEQRLTSAPTNERWPTKLNARLGIYHVDKYAMDPRGGVYFRVYSGGDGIGPDTMSYGFVHQPNRDGTPFGAAHYWLFHIVDDWYWFRASDDWY